MRIRRRRIFLGIALGLLVAAVGRPQQEEASSDSSAQTAKTGFDAFGIILERNMFDPRRRPAGQSRNPPPVPRQQVDLLGTMVTDSNRIAFVEGNATRSSQVLVGGDLVGWTVASIDTQGIVVQKDDRRLEWPVGERIERVGDGEWNLAGQVPRTPDAPRPRASSQPNTQGGSQRGGGFQGGGFQNGFQGGQRGGFGNFGGGGGAGGGFGGRGGRQRGGNTNNPNFNSNNNNNGAQAVQTRPSAPPPTGAAAEEILRQLMERRQREVGSDGTNDTNQSDQ